MEGNKIRQYLIICFLILPTFGFAQDKNMSIGIFGSLNSYNYHLEDIRDGLTGRSYEKIMNGNVGISIKLMLSERIGLRSALAYSLKGYKLKSQHISSDPYVHWLNAEVNNEDKSVNVKMEYLEIPIQGLYYFTPNKNIKIYGALGFAVNARLNNIYSDTDAGNRLEKNAPDFVYLVSLGGGVEFHISNQAYLSVEPNFSQYLNKIDKNNMGGNAQSYGVSAGLNFAI